MSKYLFIFYMLEVLIIKRLLLALVLGAIIGYERERAHKVAGLRTHILVCVSTALMALIALYGFSEVGGSTSETVARVVADLLIGIGFIGAGAIMKPDANHVMGTTTAATIWTVAAIGIAVGIGFTFAAIVVTLIGYITLTILWRLEIKMNADKDPSAKI